MIFHDSITLKTNKRERAMKNHLSILLKNLKNFYQIYEKQQHSYVIGKMPREKHMKLSHHEIMAITLLYHLSGYRNFRLFYEELLCKYLRNSFKNIVSYSWFIRLNKRYMHAMLCYLTSKMQSSHEVSYIDSTSLKACHIKRSYNHKTFKGLAEKGYTSVGWFYGFKLHLVIDIYGNIVDFCLTKGNKHDTYALDKLNKNIKGLLFGDKGYISQKKAKELEVLSIKLITKTRRNMKPKRLSKEEQALLRCRGVIETVIGQLKEMHHIENTKIRSFEGWIMNILEQQAEIFIHTPQF